MAGEQVAMGANLTHGGATFRVWAPTAREVFVRGSFNMSFCCFEIDDEFKPCRLHHWKIGRFRALEDLSRVHTRLVGLLPEPSRLGG
jgi:hypothetical protein